MIEFVGDPDGFLRVRRRLRELAQLGEAPGEPCSRVDGQPRITLIGLQSLDQLVESVRALSKVPHYLPAHGELVVR
jgi:hypothetical protein